MRFVLTLCLTLIGLSPAAQARPIHLVIDIDRTIAIHVSLAEAEWGISRDQLNPSRLLFINDDETLYYLYEGVEEIIELLLLEGVKFSFFSKGDVSRNEELLGKFKLSDGRSLKSIATTVLSAPDMPRNFKDLELVGGDLENTLLVDDTPTYVKRDQVFHWVPVKRSGPDSFKEAGDLLLSTVDRAQKHGLSAKLALQWVLVDQRPKAAACDVILAH